MPDQSTMGQPLCELLKSESVWMWSPAQQATLKRIKEFLRTSPTLVYHIVKKTVVSTDMSSYGIGRVLLQLYGNYWRPVAFYLRRRNKVRSIRKGVLGKCVGTFWASNVPLRPAIL